MLSVHASNRHLPEAAISPDKRPLRKWRRVMSRMKAKKSVRGEQLQQEPHARGIVIRAGSMAGLTEETPQAYNDVSLVEFFCNFSKIPIAEKYEEGSVVCPQCGSENVAHRPTAFHTINYIESA